jgi:glycerol-3-phosphate acyltransferase PlsX
VFFNFFKEGTVTRIALDAMGGDYAPHEVVKGAVEVAREYGDTIILVGQPDQIKAELARWDHDGLELPIIAAEQVIGMDEPAAQAVRQKPDSSIVVATKLVEEGQADAVVTAGSTGAAMVAATLLLGRIAGIVRPAAAVPYFGIQERTIWLDVGLNVDCKPQYLVQFALMGSIYARKVMGIDNPTVALLSNGTEDSKGNELGRAAFPLLKESGLNFVGNVEGLDIPQGRANVIVCDGFAGNVVLKLSEGLIQALLDLVEAEVGAVLPPAVAADSFHPALAELRRRTDYAEIGGAPALGINGVCVIGHGRSGARAVKSAIVQARLAVQNDLVGAIKEGWEAVAERVGIEKV